MILKTAKFDSNALIGWCYDHSGTTTGATLEIHVDGQRVSTITADKPLREVYPDSTSQREVGFFTLLPATIRDGVPHRVEIIETHGRARLSKFLETPNALIAPEKGLFGEFHGHKGGVLRGWACWRNGETVLPSVTVDGQDIAVSEFLDKKNSQRAQHGFRAVIPPRFFDNENHEVAVFLPGEDENYLLGQEVIELSAKQQNIQRWRRNSAINEEIMVDSLRVDSQHAVLTLVGAVRHKRAVLRVGYQHVTLDLVSGPASGQGATRQLGQYVAHLPKSFINGQSFRLYEPGRSLKRTFDIRLGDFSGRRPAYAPRTLTVRRSAVQGERSEIMPTLNYWAKQIRNNGASRLGWFSSLARETQSREARDVLALAATAGDHHYASLMEVLEQARLRSADPALHKNLRKKIWLPALFTLAQVLYSQRLSLQDFGDVYSIYEYADHTFGRDLFTNGVDRSYYADLLTQRGFTEKARDVLCYEESRHDRAYSQRYLALNTYNPHQETTSSTESWLEKLNSVLNEDQLAGIELPLDRHPDFYALSAESESASVDGERPLVTVIMPIYEPNAATDVAIRSLLEQTWSNLEIIIVDDASPAEDKEGNPTAYRQQLENWAAQDKRIKIIFYEENRGAYSVRNDAFRISQGEFVTIADKDDWHHPQRIELQATDLIKHPEKNGNIVNWARVDEGLRFQIRWGPDRVIHPSFACIMFRRAEVLEKIGYWDAIRKSADNEYRRRFELVFGQKLKPLVDAPMAFSLLGEDNLTSSDFGLGYRHPDREVYQWAYGYWHEQIQKGAAPHLTFGDGERKFHSPTSFLPNRKQGVVPHYDVVYISEFGILGGAAISLRREIETAARAGLRVGIMPLRSGLDAAAAKRRLAPEIEELWIKGLAEWVPWGTPATAALAVVSWPGVLELRPGAPPGLQASTIVVTATHLPSSLYGLECNYSLQRITRNIEESFGVHPLWAAQSPIVEEALRELLSTSDVVTGHWLAPHQGESSELPKKVEIADRPVIGRVLDEEERHWPDSAIIRDAYPDDPLFEVSLLSRIQQLKKRGVVPTQFGVPSNYSVLPPDIISYEGYLRSLNFLVHYSSAPWDQHVDGSVFRAMELGVVCVLQPSLKTVYGEAALYAAPGEVRDTLERYWANPDLMAEQRRLGQRYTQQRRPEEYIDRLKELMN